MFFDATTTEAMLWIGGVGAIVGLVAGFLASAKNLIGTMLMGVIGAISAAAILRIAGAPAIYGAGDDFSFVWGGLGALILAYVVGRSSA
jgi:uncharacterized membrane protein YeaQ/YmgE (transglycosylase-associated protein family)